METNITYYIALLILIVIGFVVVKKVLFKVRVQASYSKS